MYCMYNVNYVNILVASLQQNTSFAFFLLLQACRSAGSQATLGPHIQGVHEILWFFPRIFESLPSLPRQHLAAIGWTKKGHPIGATVHSHCVESFEGLLQQYVSEGGVAANSEKTQFFLDTLQIILWSLLNKTFDQSLTYYIDQVEKNSFIKVLIKYIELNMNIYFLIFINSHYLRGGGGVGCKRCF